MAWHWKPAILTAWPCLIFIHIAPTVTLNKRIELRPLVLRSLRAWNLMRPFIVHISGRWQTTPYPEAGLKHASNYDDDVPRRKKNLKIGKIVYISVFCNIWFSWLLGFQFICLCRVYFVTVERLRFTLTPNGKREFVPRDQVFPLVFVYCLCTYQC